MSGRSGETTEAHAEIDPENQRIRIESYFQEDGSTVMVTMILLEQDFYLMNGSGERAGVWFHTDRADLPPGGTFDTMAKGDLIGVRQLRRAGDRREAGRRDHRHVGRHAGPVRRLNRPAEQYDRQSSTTGR
ncbi:hypothetical protein O7543_13355 [Solwaraspora sp. WMMA2080]|nr:hypothetical protein [Solwaraspora sp. WMMA2080]WBC23319.1 hypothetical protein O7543_13355 [Solwaraspora sp. WMMA2080]